MCLLSCLSQNIPVPELNYPLYTAAMLGLVVTCSGLDKTQKERIKLLVERMAGVYSSAFHEGVSHLVTAKVSTAVQCSVVENCSHPIPPQPKKASDFQIASLFTRLGNN